MTRKDRKIISNDDGWILSNMTSPATPDTIKELMVDTYPGSPIGGVSWCVGNSETYEHETEVGERTGDGYEHFENVRDHWLHKNLYSLIESSGGALTEITRQFHEAGIDVLPSMRMNSHYDIAYDSPGHGKFRREHRDWLIGQPNEYIPRPSLEFAIARGVDYKFPGVRAHLLEVIFELFEKFDVDGVELDYFRHPAFFRIEEAYSNRYLMTDFIRRIRQRMDEVGEERGKHLDLLVRVPPTLYDLQAHRARRGDVDHRGAGGHRRGRRRVYAVRAAYPRVRRGGGGDGLPDIRQLRSVALGIGRGTALRAGCAVLGTRAWMDSTCSTTSTRRMSGRGAVLGNMVDREKLAHLNKRYELDHSDRVGKEFHSGAFRYALPWASLPVFMEETQPGGGSALTLDIADDVEGAKRDGGLKSCILDLGFDNLNEDDELEVRINGEAVDLVVRAAFRGTAGATRYSTGSCTTRPCRRPTSRER